MSIPQTTAMQTIVVITETPNQTYEDEVEIEADATDDEIAEAAKEAFSNRCSYGWHRKGEAE